MIGEIFVYKKRTKERKYKIIKNPNDNGTCKGCAFINSDHCEKANPKCSKLLGYGEDSIVIEIKE